MSAFSYSKIKGIIIPSSITYIGENNFFLVVYNFNKIDFPSYSKLQPIDYYMFLRTKIFKCIRNSSSIIYIGDFTFEFEFHII